MKHCHFCKGELVPFTRSYVCGNRSCPGHSVFVFDTLATTPSLDELATLYCRHVLKKTGGRKGLAAAILGIAPSTLYRRLRADKRDLNRSGRTATCPAVLSGSAPPD